MSQQPAGKPGLLKINNYFYRRGGAEAVFLDHIAMFEQAGWDVVPFAMKHELNHPSPWSDYFVSEIEYGRQTGPLTKIRQAAKVIYSFEAQRNLARVIEKRRPAVAHAHNVYHHLSPAIFSTLKSAGIPTVMTVHDLKLACPSYKMLRDNKVCEKCKGGHTYNVLVHRCIKGSAVLSGVVLAETLLHRSLGLYRKNLDRLVVPSRFYMDKLEEWGWPREQMVYIPNFIDAGSFETGWAKPGYFAFAGRLAPEKGIGTLIRAAALSKQKLVIAGTGPEEASLRALAASTGADVVFAGYLSGAALHRLIGEATALVLPSEWYENAPISVLEAYALETPVIGTRIGGIPELIRDGETGYMVAPGAPDDLAAALARMAALSAGARHAMGKTARQWVSTVFSSAAYFRATTELYSSLGAAMPTPAGR